MTRTIRHGITDLSAQIPELAAHLDESIVTGVGVAAIPTMGALRCFPPISKGEDAAVSGDLPVAVAWVAGR